MKKQLLKTIALGSAMAWSAVANVGVATKANKDRLKEKIEQILSHKQKVLDAANNFDLPLGWLSTRYESQNEKNPVGAISADGRYFGLHQYSRENVNKMIKYAKTNPKYSAIVTGLSEGALIDNWKKTATKHTKLFADLQEEFFCADYMSSRFKTLQVEMNLAGMPELDFRKLHPAVISAYGSMMCQHGKFHKPIIQSLEGVKDASELNSPEYLNKLFKLRNKYTNSRYKQRYEKELADAVGLLSKNATPTLVVQEMLDLALAQVTPQTAPPEVFLAVANELAEGFVEFSGKCIPDSNAAPKVVTRRSKGVKTLDPALVLKAHKKQKQKS